MDLLNEPYSPFWVLIFFYVYFVPFLLFSFNYRI
jgi:hypothetical protein